MLVCDILEACSLLKGVVGKVDPGEKGCGEKLGGMERGETVVGIYCMREESIFIKK